MSHISVHLCTADECQTLAIQPDTDTAESICQRLCKQLAITPACQLLFGLRVRSTSEFLPGNRTVLPNETYELRLRYHTSDLNALKRMSRVAYDYFYQQVRSDLIADRIPGLQYQKETKNQVTGLCVVNMYVDYLEKHLTVDHLMDNYQRYVPAKYVKKHSVFLRREIASKLNMVMTKHHDSYYVKGTFLESIKAKAPNYMAERCAANAAYLPEDELSADGQCPVELEFAPFHGERNGLSAYYQYKRRWVHVAGIADIYAIIIDGDSVLFEIRDNPDGFTVRIPSRRALESFVSCVCGYYRLMCKWTVNLCADFKSPQLERLLTEKCHGPIGGQAAYGKLQERSSIAGSYIVRQCEHNYDTFYIDIITKGTQPETMRLTNDYGMWQLHTNDGPVQSFCSLPDLARSIRTEAPQKLRLAPSEYDRTPTLLLCAPPGQLTAAKTLAADVECEMRKQKTQILNPVKDFRKYLLTAKLTDDGIIKEMKADWILPDDKKLEVTLKVLQNERKLMDFIHLADKWSGLFAPELVKMYGFTLSAPHTFVIESIKLGPLDEFLRAHRQVSVGCLLDACYTLARALHYLQENKIVHGRIRCCKLQVVKFSSPNQLVVRLGDPGFQKPFLPEDVPWIPIDYPTRTDRTQLDYKDEIWAFATTLWEIFARGTPLTVQYYLHCKRRLPQPRECPLDVYNIMLEGWNPNPERRFTPQMIFSRLVTARESCRNTYESVVTRSTQSINDSVHSDNTENTNLSYTSNGFNGAGSLSECSTNSGYSNCGTIRNGHAVGGLQNGAHHQSTDSITEQPTGHDDFWTTSATTAVTSLMPLSFHSQQQQQQQQHSPQSASSADASHTSSATTTTIGVGHHQHASPVDLAPLLEFGQSAYDLPDGSRVVLQGEIGYGFYGAVFRGQMEDIEERVTQVAVKMFNSSNGKQVDFEREFKIMQRLDHPNIVRIIAYMDDPVSIVMEFVEHRSFLMYLNSRAPTLTTQMLLRFARDIATGMQYLVDKHIVHRDLAARNVLVDSNECVKISDFGLAQVTDTNGYYTTQHVRNIPIKWYAPETLATIKYSHYSDVWSYGVTLYEMFSRGNQPDLRPGTELTLVALLECLRNGERLKKPPLCPDSIYNDLMMACWHFEPKKRHDFRQILVKLDQFVAAFGEVI